MLIIGEKGLQKHLEEVVIFRPSERRISLKHSRTDKILELFLLSLRSLGNAEEYYRNLKSIRYSTGLERLGILRLSSAFYLQLGHFISDYACKGIGRCSYRIKWRGDREKHQLKTGNLISIRVENLGLTDFQIDLH